MENLKDYWGVVLCFVMLGASYVRLHTNQAAHKKSIEKIKTKHQALSDKFHSSEMSAARREEKQDALLSSVEKITDSLETLLDRTARMEEREKRNFTNE